MTFAGDILGFRFQIRDRKSTRLNSSHGSISYAVFCLKKNNLAKNPAIEPPLIIALVFLIARLGFKVSVVPFHMCAPDVYQGSPTTTTALLMSVSQNAR